MDEEELLLYEAEWDYPLAAPSLAPLGPIDYTDADTAYLKLTPTLAETHVTTDSGTTYLKFTVTGHDRQRPFLFVFRYAPLAYWIAPYPHSPWTTVASNPWALGTIKVGSPQ